MKSILSCSRRSALFAGTLALVVLGAVKAHAALTWNNAGPNNNWSTTDANWLAPGASVWVNGEDAIFGATPETVSVTNVTVDDITFQGNWTLNTGTGTLTLADSNSDITVDSGRTARIDRPLAGAGSGITKLGAGTLQLFQTHTYTGATNVDAGTLWLFRGVNMATSGFVVNTGGTLTFNTWDTLGNMPSGPVNLNGGTLSFVPAGESGRYGFASTVTVNAASAITVQSSGGAGVGTNRSLFFFDNGLKGSGDLTITALTNGLGVSLRNANSTYSGHITVNGNASATAGTGSGLAIDHTVAMSSADITVNGTLEIGGQSIGLGWASSALTGQTVSIDALGGTGVVVSNRNAAGTRTLSLGNNNGGANFSGQIVDGSNTVLSLVKNGSGTQILSGANTYTGTTTINNGVLQIGNAGTAGTLGTGAVSIANGATLTFNRSNAYTVANAISGAGGVTQNGVGMLTFSTAKAYTGATIINAGTIEYTTNQTNATTYSGVGTVLLSSGVSTLNGSATFGSGFTGLINANSGGLINAFTVNMAANRGDLNVGSGVQLAINSNNVQVDALTGAGSIVNQAVVTPAAAAMTFGANNGSGTFTGGFTSSSPVNGAISLTKTGSGTQTLSGNIATGTGTMTVNGGTLILSGTNTYTGVTTVNAGTLLVNGSLSSGGGAVTVANGATLGGSGTISRSVNINAGGTLSPGNSPDQIFTGALTLAPGSFYDVEIFGPTVGNGVTGYDQTVVTGAVSLNGAFLNLLTVSGVGIGDMFTIIDNDGTDAVTGTFAGLAEGASLVGGDFLFTITYFGGVSSNDVVLTITAFAVPEPGSLLLCGLALAAGGWLTGRKRRRVGG